MTGRFSERHAFEHDRKITVREDAPKPLRTFVVRLAVSSVLAVESILAIVEGVVNIVPLPRMNLSNQKMAEQAQAYLLNCEWFYVYDVIEKLHQELLKADRSFSGSIRMPRAPVTRLRTGASKRVPARKPSLLRASGFEDALNEFFRRNGIGWQLIEGRVEYRGDDTFEDTFPGAVSLVGEAGLSRAQSEFREARRALSIRSDPDLTGAISHATNALEAVARSVTGESEENWGSIVQKHPDLLPETMMEAVRGIRKYAQENARHIREDRMPGFEDAEMAVHVSAAAATYLIRKSDLIDGDERV